MPDPFKRSRTTQDAILLAFADRLKTVDQLNDKNVVVSDQPIPDQFTDGGLNITVSGGSGKFGLPGGHHATANENGDVVVGIYLQSNRDRPGRREVALAGRQTKDGANQALTRKSLIAWKRDILSKILVDDPTKGPASNSWMPLDADGYPMLRSEILPGRCIGPLDVHDEPLWIGMHLYFTVSWDWYLYG